MTHSMGRGDPSQVRASNTRSVAAPSISVIVPLYNRARYVRPIFDVCRAQTLQPDELVFVDDCSADDPAAAIASLPQDELHVRLARHPVNMGVSAARNTGARAAESDYVAFLDSDDVWLPEKLSRQLAAIQAEPYPLRTICLTRTKVITANGVSATKPARLKRQDESWGDFIFTNVGFAQTSSFFLSRALALESPFDETLRQYEDYNFLLNLESRGANSLFVPDILTVWHNDARPGRLASMDDLERGTQFLAVADRKLTPRGRLAFQARYLAPEIWRLSPRRAIAVIAQALFRSAVSPTGAAKALARCLLGDARRDDLKLRLNTLITERHIRSNRLEGFAETRVDPGTREAGSALIDRLCEPQSCNTSSETVSHRPPR